MKRLLLLGFSLGLFASAMAGPPQKQDRTDLILDLVRNRATQQHDIWFKDGDFPRAIQSIRVLQALFPHDFELETDLGWMLENVEDYGGAITAYIKYRKNFPADPDAAYPEASLYFRERLYSKVPPLIEPAIKMPSHPGPNSYRILAGSYERMGLFKDSLRVWDTYLSLARNDGQAKLNRARVEKKRLGQYQAPKQPAPGQARKLQVSG